MERSTVSHVTYGHAHVLVRVLGLGAGGRDMARALTAAADAGATAEMLALHPLAGTPEMRFVTRRADRAAVLAALSDAFAAEPRVTVRCRADVARLTLHGEGLRVDARIVPSFQEALHSVGVTTLAMAAANLAVDAVCEAAALPRAVWSLCTTFGCAPGASPHAAPLPRPPDPPLRANACRA